MGRWSKRQHEEVDMQLNDIMKLAEECNGSLDEGLNFVGSTMQDLYNFKEGHKKLEQKWKDLGHIDYTEGVNVK